MAREENRFRLRPVDDRADPKVPIIRLDSGKTELRDPPMRLEAPTAAIVSQRLEVSERDEYGARTHEPGVEALIETDATNPDFLEHDWGKDSNYQKAIPWGWFVLLGLIIGGAITWSLTGVQEAEVQAGKIRIATQSVLGNEAQEEMEAAQLIDRIDTIIRKFFDTTSIDGLVPMVRHAERVRPLMEQYYAGKPIPLSRVTRTNLFQPITLDNQSNFWMANVVLADRSNRNVILEILDTGEPRIDWETLVCYQPMRWDSFATTRPAGVSLDFRVYLEPDHFFSHEFADATHWNCYRLTALHSDETLFGYAKTDGEVSKYLGELLSRNQQRKISVTVRLVIPEGVQSRRGVIIEELLSPRWLYVLPPKV